jgi:DnaJ-domain-containing protein 1
MNLSGRLALTTLGDLLGTLYRAEARGILELTEDAGPSAGRVHRLHFESGRLRLVDSPLGAKRLGDLLVAKGLLSRLQQFELLSLLDADSGKPTGQWLTELQWVAPAAIGEATHEQSTQRLSALYQLADARVTFRLARPPQAQLLPTSPLTPEEFLHGRPRTRDRKAASSSHSGSFNARENEIQFIDPMRRRALLLLGLEPHADTNDVRRAFRRIAGKLHPDRHLVAPEQQQKLVRERFAQMTQAYHLLTG